MLRAGRRPIFSRQVDRGYHDHHRSEEFEPLAKENAEQLFRRLIASENPPANACYVLAAMLERKRVLKQIKTENAAKGRLLIYAHGATGDVFIVPDPGLRLDELESVQNEVAQLLKSAA